MDDAHARRQTPAASGGAEGVPRHPRAYLWQLLGLLIPATIFEGYDITIFHLCTPDIAATFHLGNQAIGMIASIVRLGTVMSFLVISCSDRFGRKPVISVTVLGYGLFTLFTGLSRGLFTFTLFQSCSQVFLASEFGMAIIIISEEFPDELRGRAIAGFHMAAFVGVAIAGELYGYVAESAWGWRGMYLLGIAPLLLVAFLRQYVRETARFQAHRASLAVHPGWRETLRGHIKLFRGPYRGRLILVAVLANTVGFVGGPTITYFSLYAKRDHHWTSSQVGTALIAAYLMATVGTLLCGYLLDLVGRRLTTSLFYLGAGISMVTMFQSSHHHMILLGFMATMFTYQGSRAATSALSAEMFPTEIRAAGYSSTIQTLGQLAWFISPVLVGTLSLFVGGLGNAASLCAIGPVLGAAAVLLYAPETRGRTLEELAL
ncbi:MAG TPA: MFS transporter [Candidatus Binataceae bacterium]